MASAPASAAASVAVRFGPHLVSRRQVFYETKLSVAFVNLKPILPYHVLVIPHRLAERMVDLSSDEVSDLFVTAQRIVAGLGDFLGESARGFTISIQDGPHAGQTVPHVHVHLVPRAGLHDFPKGNDEVYERLDHNSRQARSLDDMAAEARILARLFGHPHPDEGVA